MRCINLCRRAYRGVKFRVIQSRRARHHKTLVPPYTHCKNCGHELHGIYCHACGQYARDINPRIATFLWQYCENAFQFDGKFWLTIRRLFVYPGRLSTEFMEGHIRRYVFPLKLYMLIAVLFSFVVLGVRSTYEESEPTKKDSTEQTARASDAAADTVVVAPIIEKKIADSKLTEKKKTQTKGVLKANEDVDWVNSGVNFLTRLPIAMMFAMPLFALFTRGVFRRRYRTYLPHLIFSIHIHTVFFIVLSLSVVLDSLGDSWLLAGIISAMLLWVVWYGYIAAIRFFGDRWWKVLIKNFFVYLLYYILCLLVIGIAFLFNVCYDSWAAGHNFFAPFS